MEEHVEHIVWTINGHRHDYTISWSIRSNKHPCFGWSIAGKLAQQANFQRTRTTIGSIKLDGARPTDCYQACDPSISQYIPGGGMVPVKYTHHPLPSMAPHVLHPRNLLLLVSFRVGIGKAAPSLPPLGGMRNSHREWWYGCSWTFRSDALFFLLQRHDHDRIRMNKSQSNYLQNLQILFQSRQATVATAQSI